METENNPYRTPSIDPQPIRSSEGPRGLIRAFKYSYFTSFAVAFTVVAIWLTVLFRATPPGQRTSLWPPDVLQVLFLFLPTAPSMLTCFFFSVGYHKIFRKRDDLKMWPAILFGALSGLAFNSMTAITTIEYFFDW